MTDQYEIREDELNPVYPFQVVKNGQALLRQYVTRDEAQAVIDRAGEPFSYEIPGLNALLDKFEGKPAVEEPEQKEVEDQIVIDSQEQVGSIIEFHGDKWLVVSSRYTSAKEAAEIEEAHDAYVQPGWESVLCKVKDQSLEVVSEQVQSGNARIEYHQGIRCVLFHDEDQVIPLDDLAYRSDIGLYQKSKFPQLQG